MLMHSSASSAVRSSSCTCPPTQHVSITSKDSKPRDAKTPHQHHSTDIVACKAAHERMTLHKRCKDNMPLFARQQADEWYSPIFTKVGHGAHVGEKTLTSSCSSLRLMFHSCWRPCRGPLSTTATLNMQLMLRAHTIQNAARSPVLAFPYHAIH